MHNTQDEETKASPFSGTQMNVLDDISGGSNDVVSLNDSIESFVPLNSLASHHEPDAVNDMAQFAPRELKEIPVTSRNSNFFIEDELCRFQVAHQYFQVHSHMFNIQSEKARDRLSARLHHPECLVVLEDVTPIEFEKFLTAVYSNIASEPQLSTKEDWAAVLKLSCLFDFASLRAFSIAKLFPIATAVDKIVLARKYGIDEWLTDAYVDVCTASQLPSDEESEALGLPTFRTIARTREMLYIRRDVGSHSGDLRELDAHDYRAVTSIFSDLSLKLACASHGPNSENQPYVQNTPEMMPLHTHSAEKVEAVQVRADCMAPLRQATAHATQEGKDAVWQAQKTQHDLRAKETRRRAEEATNCEMDKEHQQAKTIRWAEEDEIMRRLEEEEDDTRIEEEEERWRRIEEQEERWRREEEEEEEEEENRRYEDYMRSAV